MIDYKQIKWIGFAICFIFFLVIGIAKIKKSSPKHQTTTSNHQSSENSEHFSYTEVYELTDEPVRYVVPVGMTYELSDEGKPYYHQASNGQKEVWGGTGFHGIKPGVQFFYLERYDSKDAATHVVATYYRMMKN